MFDETRLPQHALMQNPAFAKALNICGQHPVQLPGGLMVLQRQFAGMRIAMLPRAAPPVDLMTQLRSVGLHRTPLILSPEEPSGLPRCWRLKGPRAFATWDISGSKETCRARLHSKWRNQLKRAEAQNIKVTSTPLSADPEADVLRCATDQAKTRGYALWPAPLTAAFAIAAPTQTHLFTAYLNDTDIAHMLLLTHGSTATYHIGHQTAVGKTACAHNLLLWKASRMLARKGITQIDLGVLSDATPGLNRFKLRTGAATVTTGGTHFFWRPWA